MQNSMTKIFTCVHNQLWVPPRPRVRSVNEGDSWSKKARQFGGRICVKQDIMPKQLSYPFLVEGAYFQTDDCSTIKCFDNKTVAV